MSHVNLSALAPDQYRLLLNDTNEFLRQIMVPHASNIHFQVEGVLFQASYSLEGSTTRFQVWATLGYLPYSMESAQRRRLLISLLECLRYGKGAQFGVNKENQIIVTQVFTLEDMHPPLFIFGPLLAFLQASLPFIRLIGECLR